MNRVTENPNKSNIPNRKGRKMAHPVVWWEIGSSDASKSQEFYSKMFNWKIDTESMPDYGIVETGGEGGINGGVFKSPAGVPYLTFYIQVEDVATALDKAVECGGEAVVQPQDIPNVGTSAFFKDPDGLIVGLFKPLKTEK
jgi:predicted enzyme related to lactoylglutathione lyase